MDFGRTLDASVIRQGLQELNPDINFDPTERLAEWVKLFHLDPAAMGPQHRDCSGIYFGINFICGMDTGAVPECAVYATEKGIVEIPMSDIDKHPEGAYVIYVQVVESDPWYQNAVLKAERGDDNFVKDKDGKIFKHKHVKMGRVPGPMLRFGWRATFENLIAAQIPGITREALEKKFGIDLHKIPHPDYFDYEMPILQAG